MLIPVMIWMLCSFVAARQFFTLDPAASTGIALLFGATIAVVEYLLILSPMSYPMAAFRIGVALMSATIGAATFDTVVFGPEIAGQVRADSRQALMAEQAARRDVLKGEVDSKAGHWREAVDRMNAEADGSGGSHKVQQGPIWRELRRQAGVAEADFRDAERRLSELDHEHAARIAAHDRDPAVTEGVGLLRRVDALTSFTASHPTARWVWATFFCLLVSLELFVIVVKLAFGRTVDDRIAMYREQIDGCIAEELRDAYTTLTGSAGALVRRTL